MQTSNEDLTDVHLTLHIEFEDDIYKSIHKLHKFMLVRESGKFFKALLSKKWRFYRNGIGDGDHSDILDIAFYHRSMSTSTMQSTMSTISIPEGQILEISLDLPDLISNYYEPHETVETSNLNQSIDKSFNHAFEDSFVSQASVSSYNAEKNDSLTSLSKNFENFVTPKPNSTSSSNPDHYTENNKTKKYLNETKLNRLLQSIFHYVYYKQNSLETSLHNDFYQNHITMSEMIDYIIVADYFLLKDFKNKLIDNFCQKFFKIHIEMFVLIEILGRFDFLTRLYEKALDYVRVNFGKIVIGMCVVDEKNNNSNNNSDSNKPKSPTFIFLRQNSRESRDSTRDSSFSSPVSLNNTIHCDNNPIKSISHMSNIEELFKIDFDCIDQYTLRLILDNDQYKNHFMSQNVKVNSLPLAGFGDQCRPSTVAHPTKKLRSSDTYSPSSTPKKKVSKLVVDAQTSNTNSWKSTLKNCFTGGQKQLSTPNKSHPALLELLSLITFPTIKKILENNPNGKDNQIFDIIILYIIAQSHHNKITDLYNLKEQAIELLRNYLKIQNRSKNDQAVEVLNWIRADSEYEYMDWKNKIEKIRSKYVRKMVKNMRENETTDYQTMKQCSEKYYVFKYFFESALRIFSSGSLNYDQITQDNIGSFLISILKIWLQCHDSDIKAPPTPKRRRSVRPIRDPSKRILTRGQKRSLSPLPREDNETETAVHEETQAVIDSLYLKQLIGKIIGRCSNGPEKRGKNSRAKMGRFEDMGLICMARKVFL